MRFKLKIYRDQSINLIFALLIYITFIGFFTFNLNLPSAMLYVSDALNLLLLVLNINRIRLAFSNKKMCVCLLLLLVWVFEGIFTATFRGGSFLLVLWSLRNWGRLFSFFFICVVVLNRESIESIIKASYVVFHVNFFVIVIQSLFLSSAYNQDELNGLFGRDTNCITIIFVLAIFAITCSGFFSKKISLKKLIIITLEVSVLAVVAELRAVLVFELVILAVVGIVNTGLSSRRILQMALIFVGVLALITFFSQILVRNYPEFAGFFSINGIIQSAMTEGGYGHNGYIDRLNGISVINEYFFDKMGISYKLFGLGMGNAEYSKFEAFCSPFYNTYGSTFLYLRFTSPMLYLEFGLVGLIVYTLFFLYLFVVCLKGVQRYRGDINLKEEQYMFNIGMCIALISLVFIIYNNLQRTDASYILGFLLAIPFAVQKNRKKLIR